MINNFFKFIKVNTRRPSTAWISFKEIHRFTKVAIWIAQSQAHKEDLLLLSSRISRLVQHNGFNWAFLYLKESLRLTVRYLAGTPDKLCTGKVRVRVTPQGLPVIIPFPIRKAISLRVEDGAITRATLTLLSIFRVFPTKVKPDLSSITGEFTGLSRHLDGISTVVRSFTRNSRIRLSSVRGFVSESAGPNCSKATAGAAVDAIALLFNPKQLKAVLTVLINTRSWLYLTSLVCTQILGIPYFIAGFLGFVPVPHMGRLSVVYDQAGKARIVAMTNWWIQLVLLPLEKSIFDFLRGLETDGTFNQHAPIRRLMSFPVTGDSFSCFDLSSATDRLPIDLQVDILNSIQVGLGNLWRELLDFGWYYRPIDGEVVYSVGQPMGAHSSWAMLALTHHVIVQYCASRLQYREFDSYAVLGDDIVIYDDDVAAEYLNVLHSLGVSVNQSKSVVSTEMLEFAKRLVTREHDISPIGPGAILATSRRPLMASVLFTEFDTRDVLSFSDAFKRLLSSFPFRIKRIGVVLSVFGIRGHLRSLEQLDLEKLSYITGVELIDPNMFIRALREHAYAMAAAEADKAVVSADLEERFFYRNFYKLAAGKAVHQDLFGILTLFVSPMFWLYLERFIRASVSAQDRQKELISAALNNEFDNILDTLFSQDYTNLTVRWNMREHRRYTMKVRALSAGTLTSMINDYYQSRGIAQKANFAKIHKGL